MADELTPPAVPLAVDKKNTVEETEAYEVQPDVVEETAATQPIGKPPVHPDKTPVYEVSVQMDQRHPGTIVPPEGRGSLDLPIHALAGERPEDVFTREAAENADADEVPASESGVRATPES